MEPFYNIAVIIQELDISKLISMICTKFAHKYIMIIRIKGYKNEETNHIINESWSEHELCE